MAVTDDDVGGPGPPVPAGRRPVAARDAGRHLRRGRRAARGDGPPRAGRGGRASRPTGSTLLTRTAITPGFCDEFTDVYLATGLRPVPVGPPGGRGAVHGGGARCRSTGSTPWSTTGRSSTPPTILGRGPGPAPAGRAALRRPWAGRCRPGAEEYLSWLAVEKGRSRNTLAAYRRDLATYEAWAAEPRASTRSTAGPGDLERHLAAPAGRGAQPGVAGPGHHRPAGPVPVPGGGGDHRRATRPPTCARPSCPAGCPRPWTRTRCCRLLDSVDGDRAGRPPGPGPARGALRHRGPDLRGGGPVAAGPDRATTGCCGCSARGPRSAWCPLGRSGPGGPRPVAGPVGPAPRWSPGRFARRGDAEAVFLNVRGARLSPPGGLGRRPGPGRAGRPRRRGEPPRPAPLLRQPHAGPRRRHPGGPGGARPRLHRHHPDLHPAQPGPPPGRPTSGPTRGPVASRAR